MKKTLRYICITFTLAVFFTGCTTKTPPSTISGQLSEPVSSTQLSQDLATGKLVPRETDDSLSQELSALSKTGSWTTTQKSKQTKENAFPVVINEQVQMYLELFQTTQRRQLSKWLARSGKFADIYSKELEKAGLPKDLIYLSMIESGFNERAYSRAKAVGLWQFMYGTGKDYNLTINKYIDERRDIVKSTRAAVRFLSDLYKEFGDWYLAVAAYNAGAGTIGRGLKKYNVDNFWDLAQHKYLRLETKRYVPKLIAAIIIANNPEKYGFSNIQYASPLAYDTLTVKPGFSFEAAALVAETSKSAIRDLNPALRKDKAPLYGRKHTINIPKGRQAIAKSNMKRLHSVFKTGYKTHIVRKGESLKAICRKYNLNKTTLLKINGLQTSQIIAEKKLRIPYSTVAYKLLPKGSEGKLYASTEDLILHKIRPGETISTISKKYRVPSELIVGWNGLESIHKIRAGQQLALYINDSSGKTKKAIVPQKSKKKKSMTPADSPKQQIVYYKVKSGDTLWNISRRFNTSPQEIKEWNNLKSNTIHPGKRLKLINV